MKFVLKNIFIISLCFNISFVSESFSNSSKEEVFQQSKKEGVLKNTLQKIRNYFKNFGNPDEIISFGAFSKKHPNLVLTALTMPVVARYIDSNDNFNCEEAKYFSVKSALPTLISYLINRNGLAINAKMPKLKKDSSFFYKVLRKTFGTSFTEDQFQSILDTSLYLTKEHHNLSGNETKLDTIESVLSIYKDITDDLASLEYDNEEPDEDFVINSLLSNVLPPIIDNQINASSNSNPLILNAQKLISGLLACSQFEKRNNFFLFNESVSSRKFIGKILLGKFLGKAVFDFAKLGSSDLSQNTRNTNIYRLLMAPFLTNITKSFLTESLNKLSFNDDV